ncbi:MAG: putative biotin synthesis protein BioC [Pseudomonadota bacterium]|jgi:malonyl-CoA O-methyltransferase
MKRPVDPTALARVRGRLARAGNPPWLHAEVARRMAERLPLIRLTPARVLAWGVQLGGGLGEVAGAYPQAQCWRVEEAAGVEAAASRGPAAVSAPASTPQTRAGWASWRRWFTPGAAAQQPVLAPSQVPAEQAELLWANMVLHGEADPPALLRAWHQALAVEGFLMFSTLGPGTLPELRALYAEAGWGPPAASLVDMHDIGDMLVQTGFADPVMDQEVLTLTWPDARAALAELRGLGGNVDPARMPGLRTPRWRGRLLEALSATALQRADGRVALSFELVYGHAFKVAPRVKLAPETALSATELQRMARAGRRSGA